MFQLQDTLCKVICCTGFSGELKGSHLGEELSKAAALCVTSRVINGKLCYKCGFGDEEFHGILKSIILTLSHLHHCLACTS
jgi:hypothetical protein